MNDKLINELNEIENRLFIWESCAPEISRPLIKDIVFLLEVVHLQEKELDSLRRRVTCDSI